MLNYFVFYLLFVLSTLGKSTVCQINTSQIKNTGCSKVNEKGQHTLMESVNEIILDNDSVLISFDKQLRNKKIEIKLIGKGNILINLNGLQENILYFDNDQQQTITFMYYSGDIQIFSKKEISVVLIYQNPLKSNLIVNKPINIMKQYSFNEFKSLRTEESTTEIRRLGLKEMFNRKINYLKTKIMGIGEKINNWNSKRKEVEQRMLESNEIKVTQIIAELKLKMMYNFFDSKNIEEIKHSTICQSCIFWYRLKNSIQNALGITTVTDFCDYSYIPKTLCKVTIQTTHSLTSKYLYDEKREEQLYCEGYCSK